MKSLNKGIQLAKSASGGEVRVSEARMPTREHGVHATHTTFTLDVKVSLDKEGKLWSHHDFQSTQDREISYTLPQFGVPQIAMALLTEALRREIYAGFLVLQGSGSQVLERWHAADATGKLAIEQELAGAAYEVISRTVAKIGPECAKEILAMMAKQTVKPGGSL